SLTAFSIVGQGWTCSLAGLTCTRSDVLGSSQSYPVITLVVSVSATAPSSVTNTAMVSGGGDSNGSNNVANDQTTIDPVADLTIQKPHAGNFVRGSTGNTYSITVKNDGQGPTSGPVNVVESPFPGLTVTDIGGTGWSCNVNTRLCQNSAVLTSGQ